jgi:hypothetical protein
MPRPLAKHVHLAAENLTRSLLYMIIRDREVLSGFRTQKLGGVITLSNLAFQLTTTHQ